MLRVKNIAIIDGNETNEVTNEAEKEKNITNSK